MHSRCVVAQLFLSWPLEVKPWAGELILIAVQLVGEWVTLQYLQQEHCSKDLPHISFSFSAAFEQSTVAAFVHRVGHEVLVTAEMIATLKQGK